MRVRLDIKGAGRAGTNIRTIAKRASRATRTAQAEAAQAGKFLAKDLAPFYTGAVSNNILAFEGANETWFVLSRTPSSDNGFPVNVLFDTGEYPEVTGNQPRKKNSLFFMQQTAEFLETEFVKRLSLSIERSIK